METRQPPAPVYTGVIRQLFQDAESRVMEAFTARLDCLGGYQYEGSVSLPKGGVVSIGLDDDSVVFVAEHHIVAATIVKELP
jgi:hypothetical protein